MKKKHKVFNWILLSIICQVVVLSYFNFFYINNQGEATTKLITIGQDKPKKVQTTDVPQNASSIKVSYDNTLIAYMLNGSIEIKNIKDNKSVKTITVKNYKISCFRWLPDRNMVIYGVNAPDNENGRVQVSTYNVDSDVEHNYPKITGIPKKSSIQQIEMSPLTNVVYAKVITGNGTAKIYRYNVMSELSFVMNINDKTSVKGFMYDNKMAYRDEKNRVFIWDGLKSSSKQLTSSDKLDILGISGIDDEIYLSVLSADGKVTDILKGTYDKPLSSWEKIEVKSNVSSDNLYLSPEGAIYELDKDKNTVYNLKTNNKVSYTGSLLEIFSSHIVTRDGDKVRIEEMKDSQ